MTGYITAALHRFQNATPPRPEHAPYKWMRTNYVSNKRLTPPPELNKTFIPASINNIQEIIGVKLYYGRAVDATIILSVSTIKSHQSQATNKTAKDFTKFLNYLATHPNSKIHHSASDMVIHLHRDASYLSEEKSPVASSFTSLLVTCLTIPSTNRNCTIPCRPKMAPFSPTATL